jgi:hypothetical protein
MVLLDVSKKVGLELNAEKTNYIFMCCNLTGGKITTKIKSLKMWRISDIWEQE